MITKPIRVLQIIRHMNVGGAETFIMNVYRNIDRNKVQFDFLVNGEGFFDQEIKDLGGKIYYMDYLTMVGPIAYKKELLNFFSKHTEYQIIHSHFDQVSGIILETAKKCNIVNRISHSHSTKNSNNILGKIYKKYLQGKILKNATLICACGEEAAKWLYSSKYKQAVIVNNGIDIEKFQYSDAKRKKIREELDAKDDTIIIGHIGRFSKVKNQKYLIEIYKKYLEKNKNSLLVMVGTGELKTQIEQIVYEQKLEEHVKFLGTRQDTDAIYSAIDYYIFPSFYEGLSLSLIEAQVSGLKILASDTIDKKTNISGKIEWLSIKEKPEKWAEKIQPSRETREVSKQNIEEYDIKKIAKQLQKIYMEMGEKL